MDDLLPCRFCGMKPSWQYEFLQIVPEILMCENPECHTNPKICGSSQKDIITNWNLMMTPINQELLKVCEDLLLTVTQLYIHTGDKNELKTIAYAYTTIMNIKRDQ